MQAPPVLRQPSAVRNAETSFPVTRGLVDEYADPPNPLRLLRVRRERPRHRRAAEQRELAAGAHSITSSASARSLSGTSIPSALAVLRLITKENLVGCTTGKSVGLAPFKIRPA